MPVTSTAGPDAWIRIRGPSDIGSPSITSSTWTLNDEIAVPLTTE